MVTAVRRLIETGGGVALAKNGEVIEDLPLPLGGLMSDPPGEWVDEKLRAIQKAAWKELGIKADLEPEMSLAFMSLIVIPDLKISVDGLFDVEQFKFIEPEVS